MQGVSKLGIWRELARPGTVAVAILLLGLGWSTARAAAFSIGRVSIATDGAEGNDASDAAPALSGDGRYVAFRSLADSLVPGDNNGSWDIFVRDRQTNVTERISVSSSGTEANGDSDLPPSISSDGRYVAFRSQADNLVPGDNNDAYDVFVRDRQANVTERVSVTSGGAEGNGDCSYVAISADGRHVAFASLAGNLVLNDGNGVRDVFVRDRQTNTTERVSIATNGAAANNQCDLPSISAGGQFVAFNTSASNLISGDTNGRSDIYLRDRLANTTERVSISTAGVQGNLDCAWVSSLSADGRYAAFSSYASNLIAGDTNSTLDVFVRDRQTATTARVSVATGGGQGDSLSYWPSLSANGRYVAFPSLAGNLVSGDTNGDWDLFLRDLQTGATVRLSVSAGGAEGNFSSDYSAISADGRYAAFASYASTLIDDDANDTADIFVTSNPLYEADLTPPTASQLAVVVESPTRIYLPFNLADTGSGLSSARLTARSANCVLEWTGPSGVETRAIGADLEFNPQGLASTQIRVVKVNPRQSARVELQVRDVAGNTRLVDPVIANLQIKVRQIARTFSRIPQAERYVSIQNGTPGMTQVTLTVNGSIVFHGKLTDGQLSNLDVARWLRPGDRNVVGIAARGPRGATALLTISDQPASSNPAAVAAGAAVNLEFVP